MHVYIVTAGHDYEGFGQVGVYATVEEATQAADEAVVPQDDCCHHDYAEVYCVELGGLVDYGTEAVYTTR